MSHQVTLREGVERFHDDRDVIIPRVAAVPEAEALLLQSNGQPIRLPS
jgi:hypothetical protein